MDSSLLFLAQETFLKSVWMTTLALALIATLALASSARAEEVQNVARFGQEDRGYTKRTSRFVPFLV
jgi:protein-S-isoprenylcysteine O-methyltransferase Ste14